MGRPESRTQAARSAAGRLPQAGENVTTLRAVEVPLPDERERPVEVAPVGEHELQLVVRLEPLEVLGKVGVLHAAAGRLDVDDLHDARVDAVEGDVAARLEEDGLAAPRGARSISG